MSVTRSTGGALMAVAALVAVSCGDDGNDRFAVTDDAIEIAVVEGGDVDHADDHEVDGIDAVDRNVVDEAAADVAPEEPDHDQSGVADDDTEAPDHDETMASGDGDAVADHEADDHEADDHEADDREADDREADHEADDADHRADGDDAAGTAGHDAPDIAEGDDPETVSPSGDDTLVVDVEMVEFGFVADHLELPTGVPVTFRFVNTGAVPHEAMFGSHHQQEEFAQSGDHGGHADSGHHGDVAAITLDAGETGEMVLEFAEPGELWIGCHLPGHWDAGMSATFEIV